jgi:hypothetical protein
MNQPDLTAEGVGRDLLRSLRELTVNAPGGTERVGRLVSTFVLLHSMGAGDGLPPLVDGEELVPALAAELDRLRELVSYAVTVGAEKIEEGGSEDLADSLADRSGYQYLADDFADTVAAGLVPDGVFEDADERLADLVKDFGEFIPDKQVPRNVPVSHWWWDIPIRATMPDQVWLFRYGEAVGDVRPAFYLADLDYPRPEVAKAVRRAAADALTSRRIHIDVVLQDGADRYRNGSVPTWEEFRQRHLVDGVPLPVRGQPEGYQEPPGWHAMRSEIRRALDATYADLEETLREAFPGSPTELGEKTGPIRRSPGSVHKDEELWGYRLEVSVFPGFPDQVPVAEEVPALSATLRGRGWAVGPVREERAKPVFDASRDGLLARVFVAPGSIRVVATSPRYRAPAEPSATWIIEPRS